MVLLAKNAGFCFGVKRAVDAVENNIEKNIVTLGYLIHNESVVKSLEARGVRCVSSITEVNEGETVVIRSHGVSPAVYDELDKRGIEYIDATCPFVKRIHKRVSEARETGLPVVIVGERGHPEVDGIIGWAADNAFVVYTDEEIEMLPHMKEAVVVAQTTIPEEKWNGVLQSLENKIDEIIPFSSICSATKERQDEAEEIAKKADAVIVVGGKLSSNTRKLYELCKRYCKKVYHIEHYKELLLEKMCFGDIIGIVAGASTPDTMIREVYDYMIENEKVLSTEGDDNITQSEAANDTADLTVDETDAAKDEPAEASKDQEINAEEEITTSATSDVTVEETSDAPAETSEESPGDNDGEDVEISVEEETEETTTDVPTGSSEEAESESEQKTEQATEKDVFLEGLENVIRLKKGQIVKGNIVQITDEDVCINIGYKSDGIIHKSELSMNEVNPKDVFSIGEEIEAEVINLNDGEGNVLLSRKRIEKKANWIKMRENVGTDKQYKCVVKKAVKGGVTTKVEGYSTFIPASHLSEKYIEDLKQFEGKEIEVTLIDADKRQERLVASHKNVLIKEKREKEDQLWNTFAKGDQVKGVVKRLTDFGAFVDIGGIDGLLHISDLAWSRVTHPSDVVSEGQELELLVLNVDTAKKKIALGYKQLLPKPWDLVPEKYKEGDTVMGKVVRIVPFGAFVQLEPSVDGLVHISQVSNRRLEKVEDELKLGDEIEVKILEVSADKHKISLSRKALLPVEEKPLQKKEESHNEENFRYEIPPVQESTVSLADFFPKKDE